MTSQETPTTTVERTPAFRPTAIQGLYLTAAGIYYSRYRLNGRRRWRSLETKVFTVAKLRHAQKMGEVETARQSPGPARTEIRTLGDAAAEFERRLREAQISSATREHKVAVLARLKTCWPGNFDTAPVRGVSVDTVFALREALQRRAWLGTRAKNPKVGYTAVVVNRTLATLRTLLDLAVEAQAIATNPFAAAGAVREKIFLSARSRVPSLPSRAGMDRMFAEMLNVEAVAPELRDFFRERAEAAVEFARFLAYSGMRLSEARAARVEDDRGDTLAVRGTKTAAAARIIPVVGALRTLLDAAKARGATDRILRVESCHAAMTRACLRLGIPRIRHHDLRHYFTTVCIESGVDIPTVAGWLGHADGGALLMKTYNHLRQEHSIAAARKVTFAPTGNAVRLTPA